MASGMAPIMLDTRKGATVPRKYLQNEFFPRKGADMNGLSFPEAGASVIVLISIDMICLKFRSRSGRIVN